MTIRGSARCAAGSAAIAANPRIAATTAFGSDSWATTRSNNATEPPSPRSASTSSARVRTPGAGSSAASADSMATAAGSATRRSATRLLAPTDGSVERTNGSIAARLPVIPVAGVTPGAANRLTIPDMLDLTRPWLLVLGLPAALAQGPCPTLGLTLQATGGRLGDPWSITVAGTATRPGVLGFDLTPGPTNTPFGTICLGLTPDLATTSFVLDTQGRAALTGLMPPNPALESLPIHLAAIALDAGQPSGIALSNAASIAPRQPRQFYVDPGFASPFGTRPGLATAVDLLAEAARWTTPLPSSLRVATFVRERNWLMTLLGNNALHAVDGSTGATAWSTPLTTPFLPIVEMLAPGGDRLLLLDGGVAPSPFGGGTPGGLLAVTLPSGALTTNVRLTSGQPRAVLALANGTNALLRLPDRIVPIDLPTSAVLPAVILPAANGELVDWQLAGGLLYVLQAGTATQPPALTMMVPDPLTLLVTQPLAMAAPASMLRAGPGSAGAALFVFAATAGQVHEFAQGSLATVATIATGAGLTAMELSSLGNEWLLACTAAVCGGPTLRTLPVGSTTLSPPIALPAGSLPRLLVAASTTLGRATIALPGQAQVLLTDPVVLARTVGLTFAANNVVVVAD